MTETRTYTEPPINRKEILRYAGVSSANQMGVNQQDTPLSETAEQVQITQLLEECLEEALPRLSYKVCYMELPLTIQDAICDFGCMKVQSKDLVKNLQGCEKVILFAATIGVEIDRLITKYAHISPAKAVMLQAIGAERIEALCDAFCAEMECARPRFSPGYGDLPLETQHDIFAVLNCSKTIGLSLNDSLLMSPSKSVTAFAGIK